MNANDNDNAGDEERVQVPIKRVYLERIDELAKRMKVGRGRMVAMLVEAGVDDNEWMIKFVTSGIMAPVVDMVKAWKGHKRKDSTK